MTLEFFFCIALLVMVWCLVLRIEKLEQWRRDVESDEDSDEYEKDSAQ